jgi:hypothetical protein
MEYEQGLQDFGTVEFQLNGISDAGQTRLRDLKESQSKVAFSITLRDGRVTAFMAFVQAYSFNLSGPNSAFQNSVTLRVSNAPAFFA